MEYYIQVTWPLAFALVGTILSLAFLVNGFPQINIGCRTEKNNCDNEIHNYGDDDDDDDSDELSDTFIGPPEECNKS